MIKKRKIENFYDNISPESQVEGIPKIIYKKGTQEEEDLPEEIKEIFSHTLKLNPGFRIKYFSDKTGREYVKKHFNNRILKAYDKLKPFAYKGDLLKSCFLFREGGIVSDLSDKFLVKIEDIIDMKNEKLFLGKDRPQPGYPNGAVVCAFMACPKGNLLFKKCIDQIVENTENNYYGENPLAVSGPGLVYDVLKKHNNNKLKNFNFIFDGDYYIQNGIKVCKYKFLGKNKMIELFKHPHYHQMWKDKDIYN